MSVSLPGVGDNLLSLEIQQNEERRQIGSPVQLEDFCLNYQLRKIPKHISCACEGEWTKQE